MKKLTLSTVLLVLLSGLMPSSVSAGECSSHFSPMFVRMGTGKVFHAGDWTYLANWNDVPGLYGVSVRHAQGQSCGCTLKAHNNNNHRSPTCRAAFAAGLNTR